MKIKLKISQKIFYSFAISSLLFLLQACAPKQQAPQVLMPLDQAPAVFQALEILREEAMKRQSVSGLVDLEIRARSRWQESQAAFRITAPNQLSLNFLDDFGQVYARLEANGHEVTWHQTTMGPPKRYPQNSKVLQKIFGLKLSVGELINRLLLKIPETPPLGIIPNKKALSDLKGPIKTQVTTLIWPQGQAMITTHPPRLLSWTGWSPNEKAQQNATPAQYIVNYQRVVGENYPRQMQWQLLRPKALINMDFSNVEFR